MKGGLGNLMKQAQLVQDNMKKLQEQLAVMEIEGQAASGKVRIVMTGRHEVKRVTIDPGLLSDDREMLEDLIAVKCLDVARLDGRELAHRPAEVHEVRLHRM